MWENCMNHEDKKMSIKTRSVFGAIERNASTRQSRIAGIVTNERFDLFDYRYGMSPEERELDVEETGISEERWSQKIRSIRRTVYKGLENSPNNGNETFS